MFEREREKERRRMRKQQRGFVPKLDSPHLGKVIPIPTVAKMTDWHETITIWNIIEVLRYSEDL